MTPPRPLRPAARSMLALPLPSFRQETAHDAYARLRSQARAERRKLAIVSAEVVRGAIRADGGN